MRRSEALEVVAAAKGEGVSVATMRAVPDWYALGAGAQRHIDCLGFMGGAAALGLGLALAQPNRRVIVLDGDGSLLMQLGVLAGIAGAGAANLYHFVLVNRVYETSGHQPTPGGDLVDFAALARAAGYRQAVNIDDVAVLRERLPGILGQEGPALIALEVEPEEERRSTARPSDPAGRLRRELVEGWG